MAHPIQRENLQPENKSDTLNAVKSDIFEAVAEVRSQFPEEVWDDLPTDLASNLDHYLYGPSDE